MKDKPISPVIVTFKALPGVRVQAIDGFCDECRFEYGSRACLADLDSPKGPCGTRHYIWREVPPKEGK